jgi:hypothetical protein
MLDISTPKRIFIAASAKGERKMRDRLIELIQDSVGGCARHWAEIIADHLLAEGVIVPPCKVGQTVYVLGQTGHTPTVLKGTVDQLVFNKNNPHIDVGFENSFAWDYRAEDFGKTVFLTREEAEQALERREG